MVVLRVWSLVQHHQPYLGTYKKCKFSGSSPDVLNCKLGVGPMSVVEQGLQVMLRHGQVWEPSAWAKVPALQGSTAVWEAGRRKLFKNNIVVTCCLQLENDREMMMMAGETVHFPRWQRTINSPHRSIDWSMGSEAKTHEFPPLCHLGY